MATIEWSGGVSTDWDDGDNWVGGTAPSSSDNILILGGQYMPVANVDTSLTPATVVIGENASQIIGAAGNPLLFSSVGTLIIDCPRVQELHISPGTVTKGVINNTGRGTYACNIIAGTFTELFIRRALSVRINASVTLTECDVSFVNQMLSDVNMVIAEAATVTALIQRGGNIACYADVGTLTGYDGVFKMLGTAEGDITTLNVNGFVAELSSPGMTVGTLNGNKGVVDTTKHPGVKTISAGEIFPGFNMMVNANGRTAVTLTDSGGVINEVPGATTITRKASNPAA